MTHFTDGVQVGAYEYNGSGGPGALTSPVYVYNIVPLQATLTGVTVGQAVAGAGNLVINGLFASNFVATLDVPRGVTIASSSAGDTTQTATVYGTDQYGAPVVEILTLAGTAAVNSKKDFKRVTRVAMSAATAGTIAVGTTDIFGLPYQVLSRGYIQTFWDTAFVTTGTFVAAVTTTPATGTTGDTRGTYTPPSASDGVRRLVVWMFLADVSSKLGIYGTPPYTG